MASRCDLSRGIVTDGRAGTVTFRLSTPDPDFVFKLALPLPATIYLVVNPTRPPFDDVRARRAVNYAVDRDGLGVR